MKAPDKIYMHAKEVQSYQELYGNWKIAYIRKDALLEWVNKEVDKLELKRGDKSSDGARQAFYWLTDKLNSM